MRLRGNVAPQVKRLYPKAMKNAPPARLLSPWDQMPLVAVLGLVFMYMVARGESPPLAFFDGPVRQNYMSPENLWHEAIVIAGFTWGLLWIMCASLFFFARGESGGLISMLEPVRGMMPTGILALFFGLMASLTMGRHWIYIGLGLLMACTLSGPIILLKKMPQLPELNKPNVNDLPSGRWVLGFLFINKNDARILVPRRRGGGITLNLAHGRAWAVIIFGVALPIGLAIFASFGGLF
jgi:hypothetical protein